MILDTSWVCPVTGDPKTWDTLNKTDKQQKMRVGSFVKIFGVKYTGTELCTDIKPYFAPKPARLDLYKAREGLSLLVGFYLNRS